MVTVGLIMLGIITTCFSLVSFAHFTGVGFLGVEVASAAQGVTALVAAAFVGGFSLVMWNERRHASGFLDWLRENAHSLDQEGWEYEGQPVTLDTEVRIFYCRVAFIFFCVDFPTRVFHRATRAPWTRAACTLGTLCFGWWTWLPLHQGTLSRAWSNLRGGDIVTIRQLLRAMNATLPVRMKHGLQRTLEVRASRNRSLDRDATTPTEHRTSPPRTGRRQHDPVSRRRRSSR